ncbi:MAG: glycosyltransferase WbuB [Jatrophihabitans sp.]|nr:MAG: glycosyltransferase WbuB [Jatrophihabitans sp.]
MNLHDYSGHPFQAQLSRYLAGHGHEVVHTYCAQYVTGHGRLTRAAGDPRGLEFEGLRAGVDLVKYSPWRRARFELGYARSWQRFLAARGPFDLVVACNVPLLSLDRMRAHFGRTGQRWALWHQDIYSMGMAAEVRRILPRPLAGLARRVLERAEAMQVASADAVVAIEQAFAAKYREWGLDVAPYVEPNWAPLEDITPRPRDNGWARTHGLPTAPVRLLYAGTLGRKHNPALLLGVLDRCRERGADAHLTVVSEGVGADDLRGLAAGRPDVRILGYQPASQFPDVLGSADVVLTLLEPDAARYSVPSKVLSYLCAGRTVVGLMPVGNPAAADVLAAGGHVCAPTGYGAAEAGDWIAAHAAVPRAFADRGRRARRLAEERFAIEAIGRRFEQVFAAAAGYGSPAPAAAAG